MDAEKLLYALWFIVALAQAIVVIKARRANRKHNMRSDEIAADQDRRLDDAIEKLRNA